MCMHVCMTNKSDLNLKMFAYVLSYMLDGELMFAVFDVAEVFSRPHIVLLKEHSLEAVFFFPFPLLLSPIPLFLARST